MKVICFSCGDALGYSDGPDETSHGVCVPCTRLLMRKAGVCPASGAAPDAFRRCAHRCPVASHCDRLATKLRKAHGRASTPAG
jgi:hypothetical protein